MARKVELLSAAQLMDELVARGNPRNLEGMAHYGINPEHALGVSMPVIRELARGRRDHQLALDLWATGIHEARILAALVDNPHQVTPEQMEAWAVEFNSWDVCDQVCSNLFDRTIYAVEKAKEWAGRPEEYVKRAGFVLMAAMARRSRRIPDEVFLNFLPLIIRESIDQRNFVKKAVNWALRQIGKRNPELCAAALETARRIHQIDSPSARWIASDALRELSQYEEVDS